MNQLERRLLQYMSTGEVFTADDVTDDGKLTIAGSHEPNGRQNSIGAIFRSQSEARHIVATGEVVRSRAPTRKGGMIRQWRATPKGQTYAQVMLDPDI